MNNVYQPDSPADFNIGHLKIWVHGKQYPESQEYCDGNSLHVTIHCGSPQSEVMVTGPFLYMSDLTGLREDLNRYCVTNVEKILFESMEQHFKLGLEKAGNKDRTFIYLTPEPSNEKHYYYFEVNRTDIQKCLNKLSKILENYPGGAIT